MLNVKFSSSIDLVLFLAERMMPHSYLSYYISICLFIEFWIDVDLHLPFAFLFFLSE